MPTINKTVDNAFMQKEISRSFQNRKPLAVTSPQETGTRSNSLIGTNAPAEEKDYISEMTGSRTERNHVVRDYDEDKNSFRSGLNEKMSSLKKANSNLKGLNAAAADTGTGSQMQAAGNKNGTGNLTASRGQTAGAGLMEKQEQSGLSALWQRDTEDKDNTADRVQEPQNDAEGRETSGTAANRQEIPSRVQEDVAAVREFVQDYNETVSYLNEGRDMSRGMSRLADSFEDSEGLSDSLNQIGVSLRSDGGLQIDESKLASALSEQPDRVEAALGEDGLAGRMDQKLDMASRQADRLYPSIRDAVGGETQDPAKEMYAGNSRLAGNAYSDVGSLYQMNG